MYCEFTYICTACIYKVDYFKRVGGRSFITFFIMSLSHRIWLYLLIYREIKSIYRIVILLFYCYLIMQSTELSKLFVFLHLLLLFNRGLISDNISH